MKKKFCTPLVKAALGIVFLPLLALSQDKTAAQLHTTGRLSTLKPVAARAQAQPPEQLGSPPIKIRPEIKHDISRPLREVAPLRPTGRRRETDELHPLPLPPNTNAPDHRDEVLQSTTEKELQASAGLQNILGVGADFVGPAGSYTISSIPPDTNGAVGATQYVQWVNDAFAIFNKSTGAVVYGPSLGNVLWSGFGGPCETFNDGDPVVQYDKAAGRWVLTQFIGDTDGPPYEQCVAVSTSSDATGSYYRYAFQFSNFNDYGKMGVWPDAYYMSFNMFGSGGQGLGAEVCAFDRNKMLAGQAATALCTQPDASHFGLLPSDLDGKTPPPAGAPNYFINFGSNSLNLWKFHVDFTTPANSTFTGPVSIPVAAFTPECNGGTCIPQPGTTQQLDTLADRMMFRLAYRNFGTYESLVVNHTVDAGGGRAGVRWYELRSPGTTPTVYQQGTFAPSDSLYRWMGSIAMDQSGDIALGYSVSDGNSTYPSIRVTGRVPSDTLGTMEAESSIFAGSGSQDDGSGTVKRWGDYSAMTVDPTDDCTFWYTTEYLPVTGAFNWDTRIASIKFNTCGASGAPAVSLSPTSLSFTQPVGTTSAAKPVTLTNSGTAALTITSIAATGDYSETNTCGSSLAAGAKCTINVTFHPTAAGTRSGQLTITDNASGSPQKVSLSGVGTTLVVSVSPTSLPFGNQTVGTTSSAKTVTLKNTGTAPLAISSIMATVDYSETNTCGSSLAAGASCTINVTFHPSAKGTRVGAVIITDNASCEGTQAVTLTGTGQ